MSCAISCDDDGNDAHGVFEVFCDDDGDGDDVPFLVCDDDGELLLLLCDDHGG